MKKGIEMDYFIWVLCKIYASIAMTAGLCVALFCMGLFAAYWLLYFLECRREKRKACKMVYTESISIPQAGETASNVDAEIKARGEDYGLERPFQKEKIDVEKFETENDVK